MKIRKGKIKLIFFDMEGTIFKKLSKSSFGNTTPSAWSAISRHLGQKAVQEEEKTKEKWTNGEYKGYVEWMEDTISIHKKYGLTKIFFEKVMNSVNYNKGVKETFEVLNKKGYITAVITGGFKAEADRAQIDLKIDHSFAACEYFWDSKGKVIHWNLLPCDYEGKVKFMKLIMEEHGLKKQECAFVGDGKNDVFLAKEVGLSIAFNAPQKLQKVSTWSINQKQGQEDFRAILKYL
jgi:phosphoserine phosphatase